MIIKIKIIIVKFLIGKLLYRLVKVIFGWFFLLIEEMNF